MTCVGLARLTDGARLIDSRASRWPSSFFAVRCFLKLSSLLKDSFDKKRLRPCAEGFTPRPLRTDDRLLLIDFARWEEEHDGALSFSASAANSARLVYTWAHSWSTSLIQEGTLSRSWMKQAIVVNGKE